MKIYSIFNSIDGEVSLYHQGKPSTFIRTAGCICRCTYCDTTYAQEMDSGQEKTVEEIVDVVDSIGCPKVTITGGEPLLQTDFLDLVKYLVKKIYRVAITVETSGAVDIPFQNALDYVDSWVVDYKLPSSGMEGLMKISRFKDLMPQDFVKFVVQDRQDFERMIEVSALLRAGGCDALFAVSPSFGRLPCEVLVKWVLDSKLWEVIVNLQIHKVIWPEVKVGEER